jgi:hypothetical protein
MTVRWACLILGVVICMMGANECQAKMKINFSKVFGAPSQTSAYRPSQASNIEISAVNVIRNPAINYGVFSLRSNSMAMGKASFPKGSTQKVQAKVLADYQINGNVVEASEESIVNTNPVLMMQELTVKPSTESGKISIVKTNPTYQKTLRIADSK